MVEAIKGLIRGIELKGENCGLFINAGKSLFGHLILSKSVILNGYWHENVKSS
jgi:hypothetical protein